MNPLPLSTNFSLGIERYERYDRRVRLVVYQGTDVYVCRKEAFTVLEKFTETTKAHIFRGRLQLFKEANAIHVQVKGEIIGMVPPGDFTKRLALVKGASL